MTRGLQMAATVLHCGNLTSFTLSPAYVCTFACVLKSFVHVNSRSILTEIRSARQIFRNLSRIKIHEGCPCGTFRQIANRSDRDMWTFLSFRIRNSFFYIFLIFMSVVLSHLFHIKTERDALTKIKIKFYCKMSL